MLAVITHNFFGKIVFDQCLCNLALSFTLRCVVKHLTEPSNEQVNVLY